MIARLLGSPKSRNTDSLFAQIATPRRVQNATIFVPARALWRFFPASSKMPNAWHASLIVADRSSTAHWSAGEPPIQSTTKLKFCVVLALALSTPHVPIFECSKSPALNRMAEFCLNGVAYISSHSSCA